jgi:hypothetical protein
MEDNFPLNNRRILSIYRRAVRVGVVTGILLAGLASGWLLIANRAPNYEQYAAARNLIAGIVVLIAFIIPVVRFARSPRALLLSGGIAWTILSLCYFVWTFYFDDLADRWSTLRVMTMGAVVYGFVAALAWVGRSLLAARERHHRHAGHALDSVAHPLKHS